MSLIDVIQSTNIEHAIQNTFNIKRPNNLITTQNKDISESGIEVSGLSIASQHASELNDVIIGCNVPLYHFVANGKWSCINFNKVKVNWKNSCTQTMVSGITYNIIIGHWKNGSFFPDMLDCKTIVKITPRPVPEPEPESQTLILLPQQVYHTSHDIKVPTIRFNKQELECIKPKNSYTISINRQGVYINRKYRNKTVMVEVPPNCKIIVTYKLTITYDNHVLFDQELGN